MHPQGYQIGISLPEFASGKADTAPARHLNSRHELHANRKECYCQLSQQVQQVYRLQKMAYLSLQQVGQKLH